ncbi:MAG: S8/S53 family peptidase [Saprospiraceae bacterium]|nr:S8/S53 family peptidase [Saprospiraceae bacterium]
MTTLALLIEESNNGYEVMPNIVIPPSSCPTESSQEYKLANSAPNPALANEGFWNAYREPILSDSDIDLIKAWQFAEVFCVSENSTSVAFIDQGFSANADFPFFDGWDLIDDDDDPNGISLWAGGGFHGNEVMSYACARINNRFGGAGTGAQVIRPLALRASYDTYGTTEAIYTAIRWGADVINLSQGTISESVCGLFCRYDGDESLSDAIDEALRHGIIIVSIAGNTGDDLDEVSLIPAESGSLGHPIIVGNFDLATKRADLSSGYGSVVNIWAPGGSMPTAANSSSSDHSLSAGNGTSFSSAYITGIVALMKSIAPELNNDETRRILETSANTSTDTRISTGLVDAYAAIRLASNEAGVKPGRIFLNRVRWKTHNCQIRSGLLFKCRRIG